MSPRLSTVATALAFLAIPTIASAHAGNTDPNVVHACINNNTKDVRVVGVNDSCISQPASKAETPAHWAIQGPQGAPGTNGTNGANGINGINGTNGTNGTDGSNGAPGTNGTNGIDGTNGTRAAPPCFDNTNRYVDCLNGTVTDTVTGLIWLQQADCLANANYSAANQAAAGLKEGDCSLTDGSSPGDWRLPTRDEWKATIARALALNCVIYTPSLTRDAGTTCFGDGTGSSFAGVPKGSYWSSTTVEIGPPAAWVVDLYDGFINGFPKGGPSGVWPVRGGPR